MTKYRLLDLLFKYKPLFRLFVWIDYLLHVIKYNSIQLTSERDKIRINDFLCGFHSNVFMEYEVINEENIDLSLLG